MTLEIHPAAKLFNLMDGKEFDALVVDIREHGLREAITIHEGMILDGRNRYRACEAAGVPVRLEEFEGSDPLSFVVSKNLHRRHLSESQRAMAAKRAATMRAGGDRRSDQSANLRNDISQEAAAQMLNVSRRAVQHAGVVQEKAAPELVDAVDRGDISVSTAATLVNLPKSRQRKIAAAGKAAATKAAKQVRARKQTKRQAKPTAPAPKETEHGRDLRFLRETWAATCSSAHAAFLKEIGVHLKAVA